METSNGSSNLRNCEQTCEADDQCFEDLSSEGKEGLRSKLSSEEVPYWLKDLLDEPADIHRSHRRSSSDSIAYIQKTIEKAEEREQEESKHRQQLNNPSLISRNISTSTDSSKQQRVKRHSAQQHRARKVQYIAELERGIQALQVEGYEVSAELEFLDQQNLILSMENRALKQHLDTLSQQHFIKCLEQEVLEREITRLRNLYQQQHKQQQQKQQHYGRNRSKRQDLDSSFAKLSLKNKGTESQKAR